MLLLSCALGIIITPVSPLCFGSVNVAYTSPHILLVEFPRSQVARRAQWPLVSVLWNSLDWFEDRPFDINRTSR